MDPQPPPAEVVEHDCPPLDINAIAVDLTRTRQRQVPDGLAALARLEKLTLRWNLIKAGLGPLF